MQELRHPNIVCLKDIAHGDNKLKAVWWLSACLGQHNDFRGEVYDYQPVWGSGAALVGLFGEKARGLNLEYDEDNTEHYRGDRNVLSS